MSLKPFDTVLQVKPQPSTTFTVLLILLHVMAVFSVVSVIPDTHPALFLFVPLFLYSAYHSVRKYALLSVHSSVIDISQSTHGDWLLKYHDQTELHVELCDDSYVHPLLVILNFKMTHGRRRISLPLFRDALGVELHRQLRSRLKLSRPAEKEKLLRR